MNDNLVSDRPPLPSLLRILLLLLFGFVILGPLLGVLAASFIYDGDFLKDLQDPLHHPDIRDGILLMQGIGASVGLIFLPWFYLKISERRNVSTFFKVERQWPLIVTALSIAIVSLSISISPLAEWNANIEFPGWLSGFGQWARETEEMAEQLINAITGNLSPIAFVFAFIVVAVLPGIGEELVFRGLIQTELLRAIKNPHVTILLTSILFSAFHMQFLGFVPRTLIGAFLGYLYYWSENLWVPMLAHFLNNGIQIVGLYLFQRGVITYDIESTESAPWPLVAVAIVLTVLLLFFVKNLFTSHSANLDLAEKL